MARANPLPVLLGIPLVYWLFGGAAVATGVYLATRSHEPKQVLPGITEAQDSEVKQVVAVALQKETDPAALDKLASLLTLAGYTALSQQVNARRNQLGGA